MDDKVWVVTGHPPYWDGASWIVGVFTVEDLAYAASRAKSDADPVSMYFVDEVTLDMVME
jgi:hypothetical protein